MYMYILAPGRNVCTTNIVMCGKWKEEGLGRSLLKWTALDAEAN